MVVEKITPSVEHQRRYARRGQERNDLKPLNRRQGDGRKSQRSEFEKFDAQVLDRVRWIAGHEVGVVARQTSAVAPERIEGSEVVKVQPPVLIDQWLVAK